MKTHADVIRLLDKFSKVNDNLYYAYFPEKSEGPASSQKYHFIFIKPLTERVYKGIKSASIHELYYLLRRGAIEEVLFYKDQEVVYGKRYSFLKAQLDDIVDDDLTTVKEGETI